MHEVSEWLRREWKRNEASLLCVNACVLQNTANEMSMEIVMSENVI